MSTYYIGLKMGSTNTIIYKPGNGVILQEASLIAMSKNPKDQEIKAIGNDALALKSRLPENIAVYSPISNGVVQYESLAVSMLKHFMKKIFPRKTLGQNIKAIVTVPIGISAEEKKAFEITCFKAGIADVKIIPDIICHAIGSGIDIQSEKASMLVDIGGNTTNIAVVANNTILQGVSITIGGSIITSAIVKYIHETYSVLVSPLQAEHLKIELCSLLENYQTTSDIEAFSVKADCPQSITISSRELYPIIVHYYSKIAETIKSVIQECPPQVISDITNSGINFYGSPSSIIGMDKFMYNKLGFVCNISDNKSDNMLGIGELIKYPQLLHKLLKNL